MEFNAGWLVKPAIALMAQSAISTPASEAANLTPENIYEKAKSMDFPDSVVTYFEGMMGQPEGGFPEKLQQLVLKGKNRLQTYRSHGRYVPAQPQWSSMLAGWSDLPLR